jgi:hypothetical protein
MKGDNTGERPYPRGKGPALPTGITRSRSASNTGPDPQWPIKLPVPFSHRAFYCSFECINLFDAVEKECFRSLGSR